LAVDGTFYSGRRGKVGSSPASPSVLEGETQTPVNPEGFPVGHVPVSIGGYPNGLTIDATTQVLNLEIGDGLGVDGYGRLEATGGGGGGISDAPNDGLAYTRKSLAWAQSSPYDLKQEGATDGQVLAWSNANSRFQPTTASGAGNFIAYDVAQTLTDAETAQARTNIGSSASTPQTVATTGTINDLGITSNCVLFTGAGSVILNGIVAGSNGVEIQLINATGNTLTVANNNTGSSVNNRFFGGILIANNQSARFKYVSSINRWINISGAFYGDFANGVLGVKSINPAGINIDSIQTVALNVRSNSGSSWAARFLSSTNSVLLELPESGLCSIGTGNKLGVNRAAQSNVALVALCPATNQFAFGLYTNAGANGVFVNNSMDWASIGGAIFGGTAGGTPTARVDVRGRGTTTGNTLLLEDSAGTDNALFLDNGQIRFLRLPTASAGLAAGSLWNDSGTIKIV
jgi:hypothetical protein